MQLLLKDKDLVDKSQDAFVSFLRYYKEHQLSFIFAFSQLDIGHVANSFFLFRLPRVKEILGRKIEGFETRKDVDLSQIAYSDKNQGKQFADKLSKRKQKFEDKQERKEKSEVQKTKSDKRKNQSASVRKRHRREIDWQEWDELAAEERAHKKNRRKN
jgi:ATP-dependent RNA helicase DDX55/SPB4